MSLEDIKARAEAATEGPWVECHENGTPGQYEPFHCPPATGAYLVEYGADWNQKSKDATFIANARTDIPKLVAAIEAVVEYVDQCGLYPIHRSEIENVITEALA